MIRITGLIRLSTQCFESILCSDIQKVSKIFKSWIILAVSAIVVSIAEESDGAQSKKGGNATFGVNAFGFQTLTRITGYLCVETIVVWQYTIS